VGGQYNFVAMAHELDDGRSILLLRATRREGGEVRTNIRFNYGHVTIPRHLRDIVVTEYGAADLRGKSDSECIEAMLSICDARFLDALAAEAKANGKLAAGFRIPEAWRRHRPECLEQALAPLRRGQLLPAFPFGSDFSDIEQQLVRALGWLKDQGVHWRGRLVLARAMLRPGDPVAGEEAALERMQLAQPKGMRERLQQRLVAAALRRSLPW